jgi:D-serine deaminase-like pyridoxal phosphate-dependent protein
MAFTNEYSESLQANLPSQRFALAFAGLGAFEVHLPHKVELPEKTPRLARIRDEEKS